MPNAAAGTKMGEERRKHLDFLHADQVAVPFKIAGEFLFLRSEGYAVIQILGQNVVIIEQRFRALGKILDARDVTGHDLVFFLTKKLMVIAEIDHTPGRSQREDAQKKERDDVKVFAAGGGGEMSLMAFDANRWLRLHLPGFFDCGDYCY